ncbi:MAG: hypothetical protein ACLQVD_09160 [Capsulimonadaceae bacterium]
MSSRNKKLLVAACALPAAILVLGGALTFHTIVSQPDQDVSEYFRTSTSILHGSLPYRDFRFEYPIAAIVPMLMPHFLLLGHAHVFAAYATGFLSWNALLAAALGATLVNIVLEGWEAEPTSEDPLTASCPAGPSPGSSREARAANVLKYYCVMLACTVVVAPWRFDLFPAWLSALTLLAIVRSRPGLAGALIALGTAVKLYPVLILPAIAFMPVKCRAGALRAGVGFAIALAVIASVAGVYAGFPQLLSFVKYHQDRGIQIESVPAGMLFVAGALHWTHLGMIYNFGAYHLVCPWSHAMIRALGPVLVVLYSAALVPVSGIFRHTGVSGLSRGCALLILVFIVTSKVFSIQYVIWVLPFASLFFAENAGAAGERLRISSLALFVLTAVEVILYAGLHTYDPMSIVVLNLRNAAAVALTVTLMMAGWSSAWHANRTPESGLSG